MNVINNLFDRFIVRSPPSSRKTLPNSPSLGSASTISPVAEVASNGSLSPPTAHTRNRSRSPTTQMANVNKHGSEQAQVTIEMRVIKKR